MKKNVSEVRKIKKKTNVSYLELGRKMRVVSFQKVCAGAKESRFFYGYNEKVRIGDFFKMIRVTIEKKVYEVRRKYIKLTFEISNWVIKNQTVFFSKFVCSCHWS